ncbi:MAG: translation elongation factor 4, partial [Chloroflexi bacterium]|nr:translation elongation factor 4 [Chloroflexota bacterium]
MDQARIRNFCIIAHIDHGKSTLADRILDATRSFAPRAVVEQALDSMDLERERGITIKMTAVRLRYVGDDGLDYELNLIDTPGHVDFTYEVSRSLAACEGAILVVDAAQGVEAQTMANVNLALANNLTLVPVINKIDLPSADPDRVKQEMEDVLQIPREDCILASAREGIGTRDILEAVVHTIPPPSGGEDAPLRALIFDSHYDAYLGVVCYIRVVDGRVGTGSRIKMMSNGKVFEVLGVGVFTPEMTITGELGSGQVGYIHASIRNVEDTLVGDTITAASQGSTEPLPGFREPKPMVFCGLYPTDSNRYPDLREALSRMKLNDAALHFEPESSAALGFGFRCGFLGLLHMEIAQERLEREFGLSLIATAPSVIYHVFRTDGNQIDIDNPDALPPLQNIDRIEEPFVSGTIMVPSGYIGPCMELAMDRRGIYKNLEYLSDNRAILSYELPLGEIIMDFFDQLKSRSKGYATFDYEFCGYRTSSLVKLDILLNGDKVDALSFITHRDKAFGRGKLLVERLKAIL